MEATYFSVTSILTRSTRHYISEDGTHHSHRRENLNIKHVACIPSNVAPRSWTLFTMKKKASRFSETSVILRPTRHHIPEDGTLHNHRHANLKSYKKMLRVFHQTLLLARGFCLRWRRRRHSSPKRHFSQDLHSATPHKTALFIVTAVKTSYPRRILRAFHQMSIRAAFMPPPPLIMFNCPRWVIFGSGSLSNTKMY
jgi:hypothetical protein